MGNMQREGVPTRNEKVVTSFVGILRAVKSEDVAGQSSEEHSSKVQKIKL